MKKLFLVVLVAAISSAIYAQDNKWAAGISFGYGSEVGKPSIGAKVLYNITDKFTVAPSFNYYFKDSEEYSEGGADAEASVKCWDINVDLHWNVVAKEKFNLYPLVGITYFHAKGEASASASGVEVSTSASDGKVGANIGIGGQLNFASNWAAALELKYQIISDYNQFVPALSIMYRF